MQHDVPEQALSARGLWRSVCAPITMTLAFVLSAGVATADSKLLATGGGQQIEGQGGGGIVPWGLIAGYADAGAWGGSAALTRLRVDDLELTVAGLALGVGNRFEVSAARQRLHVRPLDLDIDQDVFAAKLRLTGDAVYGPLPAITAGALYKRNRDFTVPAALGAEDDAGTEFTVAAARLWLNGFAGRNVFTNLTLRNTDANQTGFLGFGGPAGGREWLAEGSLGLFLNRHWVMGLEYRDKPDRLSAVREEAWWDAFVGWFPNKRVSLIAAWANLGDVAGLPAQDGLYLSLQFSQ